MTPPLTSVKVIIEMRSRSGLWHAQNTTVQIHRHATAEEYSAPIPPDGFESEDFVLVKERCSKRSCMDQQRRRSTKYLRGDPNGGTNNTTHSSVTIEPHARWRSESCPVEEARDPSDRAAEGKAIEIHLSWMRVAP